MKKGYNFIYTVILALIINSAQAQTFIPKADFPDSNRSDMGYFTIGTNIYSLGGIDSFFNFYSALWQYNTLTDTWTKKADFSSPTLYAKGGTIGDKVYLGNFWDGGKSNNGWWEYNATTDKWTQKTSLPGDPRFGSSSFEWNNEVYVISGESYDTTSKTYKIFNDFYKYSPNTDSWTELDTIPMGGRTGAYSLIQGNTLYFGMGQNDGDGIWYDDLHKYDLINNTWTSLSPLPFSPSGPAGDATFNGIYNGKIILFNTDWNFEEPDDFNNIYVYDIASDTWTIYPDAVPVPWRIFGWHGQIGSKAYYGQGRDYLTNTFYTDNYEIDLAKVITSVEEENPILSNIKIISTTRKLIISIPENDNRFQLNIQSIDGRQLKTVKLSNENTVDISTLPDGIYIWTISLNGKIVKSGRVIRS